jgi:hypothetical protein
MSIEGVTAELLVRYLDTWVPGALRSGRRATFVRSWPERGVPDAAESALRVFAEFADQVRGRQVTLVFVAPDVADVAERVAAVQAESSTPAALTVHALGGPARTHVAAAISAAQAAGAPLFACVEGDEEPPLAAIASGRPAEVMLLTAPGGHDNHVAALHRAGFALVTAVVFVGDGVERLVVFGTSRAGALETFKDALWQLDEYAGVFIRDPYDPDAHLLDISLNPHPGPLRRYVLAHLAERGSRTVTEIRHAALADTVYRAADVTHVLQSLVTAHTVARDPAAGRLAGDTILRLPEAHR